MPAVPPLPATRNLLLGALPDAEYCRLAPHLEYVELSHGAIISGPGEWLTHALFPTDGIVALLANLERGISVEIASIGQEGMLGTSLFLEGVGALVPSRSSVVQFAGHGYRLRANILMAEFERSDRLRHRLLLYTQALITQIAQIAVCNRHHELEAQLCRWMLQRFDRLARRDLCVTQVEIANLLGVRRAGITEAAGKLQEAGLIRYRRGRIELLDRSGLEQRACECLGVIQKEYARLLGD